MVLGLNDALVELTGALAGLTFAFQNTRLISIAGLITGVAASLSMAASEYLSKKSEESSDSPYKASLYTGIAYIVTVILLILPYLILNNPYLALAFTILIAIIIIFVFNFYIAIAKEIPFKKRFFEAMADDLNTPKALLMLQRLAKEILKKNQKTNVIDAKAFFATAFSLLGLTMEYK